MASSHVVGLAVPCLCLHLVFGVSQVPAGVVVTSQDVRRLLDRGDFGQAEQQARRVCDEIDAREGGQSIEFARASDLLVEALVANGKGGLPDTLALAQRVVGSKERLLGTDNGDVALSLDNLGMVHVQRGEFRLAIRLGERVLSIRSRILAADDPAVADSLDRLALPLIRLQRFDEARPLLVRAQRIRELRSQDEPIALARTLELVALLNRYSGGYAAAMPPLERALLIRRRLAPDHPDVALALHLQGEILWLGGNILGAQRTWREALALGERTVGPEHPIIALVLRKLALASADLGNLAEGRRLLERALQIGDLSLAPCNPELPALLADLASSVMADGEYADARRLYQRALTTYETCLGPGHSLTATVVYNQGLLSAEIGDLAEAERLQQRAVRIWSTGLGPKHPYVARALDALAEVVAARGQLTRADALYKRALDLRRGTLGADHPAVAWTLTNRARNLASLGRLSPALQDVDEAIRIYHLAGASDEPDHLARVLTLRGAIEMRRGHAASGRLSFAEALSARESIFGKEHPLTAQSRADRATADFALGAYGQAFADALDAERVGRDHLRFTIRYLPERQAMTYAAKRPRGLDLALSILSTGHATDTTAAIDAVIQTRAVVLDELAARARSSDGSDPALAALHASVVAVQQRFANLMLRSLQGEESVSRAVLDEARQQKEEAERSLAERSAAVRSEIAHARVGLDEVRRALPKGAVLVSFVRYDRTRFTAAGPATLPRTTPSYLAFVIRTDSTVVDAVPLGSAAALEPIVSAWRAQAGGRALAAGTADQAERAYRTAATRLRRQLWDPVAAHIAGASLVFVVPDGAVNLVSLSALPTTGGRFLIDDGPGIHYLSTERDLVSTDSPAAGHGLLAVGGPAFDERMQPATAAGARRSASGCETLAAMRFEPLPGSKDEVLDLGKLWPAGGTEHDRALVLSGASATESAVKRAAAGRRVVHLATHGFFLRSRCDAGPAHTRGVGALASLSLPTAASADNTLLLSGLAFAGANRRTGGRPDGDDGILTAEEVAGLNLQGTEWAVLSACDTGIGEIKAGEGVFGLRRAFQIAGARTIIMSLWSVEDRSTRLWMRALYEGRFQQHLSTADAMRAASLRVLQNRRAHGESTHPFYWAAFVAAGDWK
jgi:CHAT domain-containing protein